MYYSAHQNSKSAKSYFDINLFGLRTIYIVVFLCCSVLSLFSYGLLYSVCLLYIVVNNDILQRALQSVTKHGTTVLFNPQRMHEGYDSRSVCVCLSVCLLPR